MEKKLAQEYVDKLNDMIKYCEGAKMAAQEGDYLHNFTRNMQFSLRDLRDNIGYEGKL